MGAPVDVSRTQYPLFPFSCHPLQGADRDFLQITHSEEPIGELSSPFGRCKKLAHRQLLLVLPNASRVSGGVRCMRWLGERAYLTNSIAAAISSAIIFRLLFSMKKLGPACG